ncbi:MAG: protease inhibitor I42 family protein [Smithellaceae bacterium]|jgi:inhibitor of cysteine peptidase|nr:protease inhibitor I42 family protein [Syntrophaceae bacterium]MBP8608569.1 protease inhibitor I42 family protein [Syntrophaceae bacterium]MDX9816250.1 protease inhibitor I42 family protein [Smithellaceae bacterium]NMD06238.1 protease inhibitor I42 family protein [Deltaproteobacteria bacterium]
MKKRIILGTALIILASFYFARANGQSEPIVLKAGDSFTVTLRANASTGYQWQLKTPLDESILQLIDSKYIPYKSRRIGADGKQLWTFKALKTGQATIFFKYVRSWEKDLPPQREQSIKIIVK